MKTRTEGRAVDRSIILTKKGGRAVDRCSCLSDEFKPLISINIGLKQNIIIIRQNVCIKNLPPK